MLGFAEITNFSFKIFVSECHEVIDQIQSLIAAKQSLKHINLFNTWLIELHKLGYVTTETAWEAKQAEKGTPPSKSRLQMAIRKLTKKSLKFLKTEAFFLNSVYRKRWFTTTIKYDADAFIFQLEKADKLRLNRIFFSIFAYRFSPSHSPPVRCKYFDNSLKAV